MTEQHRQSRHRRLRLRRARHGDRARSSAGHDDFVDPRAGRRPRRHLAGQPLPGLRLRRPDPALLVLVRAQPRLVAALRAARRDPRLPRGLRRPLRRPRRTCGPTRRSTGAALGRRAASAGPSMSTAAGADRPRARRRHRRAVAAGLPDIEGLDDFAGPWFHSARVGPLRRPRRGTRVAVVGTGASAIQFVPQIAPRRRAHVDVFQRTPPWVIPKPDRRDPAARAGAVPARARARSGLVRGRRVGDRRSGCGPGNTVSPALHPAARGPRPAPRSAARSRTRSCGPAHARLRDRLQAAPAGQRLVPGPRPRER